MTKIFEEQIDPETLEFVFVEENRLFEERPNHAFGTRWRGQRAFVTPKFVQIVPHQCCQVQFHRQRIVFVCQILSSVEEKEPFVSCLGIEEMCVVRVATGFVQNDTFHEHAQHGYLFRRWMPIDKMQFTRVLTTVSRRD